MLFMPDLLTVEASSLSSEGIQFRFGVFLLLSVFSLLFVHILRADGVGPDLFGLIIHRLLFFVIWSERGVSSSLVLEPGPFPFWLLLITFSLIVTLVIPHAVPLVPLSFGPFSHLDNIIKVIYLQLGSHRNH